MPALNDQGEEVSVVEDFAKLDKWIAPKGADFKTVIRTGVDNPNNLNMEELYGYIGDTYNEFAVKNVIKEGTDEVVCQMAQGPWEDNKMEFAMAQLNLKLASDENGKPVLIDENVKVVCKDKKELRFTGGWYIRAWKIDLVVKQNDNGIEEVEMLRDEITWIREKDADDRQCHTELKKSDEQENGLSTSTYWIPYD